MSAETAPSTASTTTENTVSESNIVNILEMHIKALTLIAKGVPGEVQIVFNLGNINVLNSRNSNLLTVLTSDSKKPY